MSGTAEKNMWVARFLGMVPGGGRTAQDSQPKIETRSYVRDISPELRTLLSGVHASARKDVQDWWADVIGHLPPCEIAVDVQADAAVWRIVDNNVVLENQFGLAAHERVEAALEPLSKSLLVILARTEAGLPVLSGPPSKKTQANIDAIWASCQEECGARLAEFQDRIAKEVSAEIEAAIAEIKEIKTAVRKYRFVATARVAKGVVLIAGNIAHAAASWGATSPLAIVAIVRQSIEIAQIVGKGLVDAEEIGQLVVFDLKVIKKFYTDDAGASKTRNSVLEALSGAASGILNLELPNINNCTTHIGDFDHKVNLIFIDYTNMGKQLAKLRDKIDSLDKKIADAGSAGNGQRIHKTLSNNEVIAAFDALATKFGTAYTCLFEDVPKVKGQLDLYRSQSEEWKTTLAGYDKQTHGFTKKASALTGFATEAGLGMGHVAGEHVEGAAELATQHLKEGLEAVTVAMNGLADFFLEKIND